MRKLFHAGSLESLKLLTGDFYSDTHFEELFGKILLPASLKGSPHVKHRTYQAWLGIASRP